MSFIPSTIGSMLWAGLSPLINGGVFGASYVLSMRTMWDLYTALGMNNITSVNSAKRFAGQVYDNMKMSYQEVADVSASQDQFNNWFITKAAFFKMSQGMDGEWVYNGKNRYSFGYGEPAVLYDWVWFEPDYVRRVLAPPVVNSVSLNYSKYKNVYPSAGGAYEWGRPTALTPPSSVMGGSYWEGVGGSVGGMPSGLPTLGGVNVGVSGFSPVAGVKALQSSIDQLGSEVQSYWAVGNYQKAFELANQGVSLGYWSVNDVQNMRLAYEELMAQEEPLSAYEQYNEAYYTQKLSELGQPVQPTFQELYQEEYYRQKLAELQEEQDEEMMVWERQTPDFLVLPEFSWIKNFALDGDLSNFKNALNIQRNMGLISNEAYIAAVQWAESLPLYEEDEGIDEADVESLVEAYLRDKTGDYDDVESVEWI